MRESRFMYLDWHARPTPRLYEEVISRATT
jgi:hypothetical protein